MGVCPSFDPEMRVLHSHNVSIGLFKAKSKVITCVRAQRLANVQFLHCSLECYLKLTCKVHVQRRHLGRYQKAYFLCRKEGDHFFGELLVIVWREPF